MVKGYWVVVVVDDGGQQDFSVSHSRFWAGLGQRGLATKGMGPGLDNWDKWDDLI